MDRNRDIKPKRRKYFPFPVFFEFHRVKNITSLMHRYAVVALVYTLTVINDCCNTIQNVLKDAPVCSQCLWYFLNTRNPAGMDVVNVSSPFGIVGVFWSSKSRIQVKFQMVM